MHPSRKDENETPIDRTLVSQSKQGNMAISESLSKDSADFQSPRSFGAMPSPMRSVIAGAALRSEEDGVRNTETSEKESSKGASPGKKPDLDALAVELAGRIQKRLSKDAERRGRWR